MIEQQTNNKNFYGILNMFTLYPKHIDAMNCRTLSGGSLEPKGCVYSGVNMFAFEKG